MSDGIPSQDGTDFRLTVRFACRPQLHLFPPLPSYPINPHLHLPHSLALHTNSPFSAAILRLLFGFHFGVCAQQAIFPPTPTSRTRRSVMAISRTSSRPCSKRLEVVSCLEGRSLALWMSRGAILETVSLCHLSRQLRVDRYQGCETTARLSMWAP